jgi:hypothetical protein
LPFCAVCDKEIATSCPSCNHKKANGEYTEVQMEWSNGSKMTVAVCVSCAASHAWATPEAKEGITKAHWAAWDKAGGKYSREVVLV